MALKDLPQTSFRFVLCEDEFFLINDEENSELFPPITPPLPTNTSSRYPKNQEVPKVHIIPTEGSTNPYKCSSLTLKFYFLLLDVSDATFIEHKSKQDLTGLLRGYICPPLYFCVFQRLIHHVWRKIGWEQVPPKSLEKKSPPVVKSYELCNQVPSIWFAIVSSNFQYNSPLPAMKYSSKRSSVRLKLVALPVSHA